MRRFRTPWLVLAFVALAAASPPGGAPLWVDAAGRPTADARAAMARLADAASDGLVPDDYCATALAGEASALDRREPAADGSAFDAELTSSLVRYLQQLHEGRLDPRRIGFRMTAPPDHHDFEALLRSAAAAHRLDELFTEMTPQLPIYRGLRQMLARYRVLAGDPTLALPPATTRPVHPGEAYAGIVELHRLLVALGDLPSDTPPPDLAAPYGGVLVAGVEHFQARHGLAVDGVLGPRTEAALQVPLARRVRQIELALERLRWLPHLDPDRFLVVNIPTFRLVAWDADRSGPPALTMGVIVGRALDRETPVFAEEMTHVIFRPYWNVPISIARDEILPAVRRNPGYLRKNDMEVVAGPADGSPVVAATAANLARVAQGKLRIRQRPGPQNALGRVKFVFPNDADVYMHDTPAAALFQRPRRDFSHGCIRLEDPTALAEWVLMGRDGWTRERILAAMDGPPSRRVDLARPLQVIIFYMTAVVVAQDGSIHFAEDVYGHDERLERALAGRFPMRRDVSELVQP